MWATDSPIPFIQRFAAIAAARADHPAIETAAGLRVSYGQLLARAIAWSVEFRDAGLKPGGCVAVELPKSPDYVAALIAVWLCEAVFLPVDVHLPPARRARMLAQARPGIVIDRRGWRCCGDRASTVFTGRELPAYLIFTSGSTGRPKGVLVSHAGLVGLLDVQIAHFGIDGDGRCLWMHGTGFDASLSDIGTTLLAGATLCFDEETPRDLSLFQRMGISHVDVPPALLPWLNPRTPLRGIVIGGDVCPPAVVRQWAARTNLVCVYGPTEATICTSLVRCGTDWDRAWIGTPVPGISYGVHGPDGGETDDGELWITGDAVALGYPWEPDLMERRFVDQGRTFRTGDRVRRHACGGYEFLGRLDRQFKLDGRLVCPEEVENALLETGLVTRARVVRREVGRRTAIAAVVETTATTDDLRALLARSLPQWMVPTAWDTTTGLPETANGKPDDATIVARLDAGAIVACESPSEEAVVRRLFADSLQREDVGADEDFFDQLGGDSLAVVIFFALAGRRGVALPPDALHRGRTPAGVAGLLRDRASEWRMADDFTADIDVPWTFASHGGEPPRNVLLTGATGFLGKALARQLTGSVLPLSRTTGDVRRRCFGWDEPVWRERADVIDTVVHLAADVRLFAPYEMLRETQVFGTREVLRFCATGRPKTLHYASTLSVFVDADPRETLCLESDTRRAVTRLHGGYAQSKWVAEQLVLLARERGLRAGVHRLGLLSLSTSTGQGPRNDWFTLALPGLLERSCGDPERAFDLTPVDYAARVMGWLIETSRDGVFHVAAPRPVTRRELDAVGLPPRQPSADGFAELAGGRIHRSLDVFKCSGIRFDRSRTDQAIAGSGIVFPELTNHYLRSCVAHAQAEML